MNLNRLLYHLFYRCWAEEECLITMKAAPADAWTPDELAVQQARFDSVFQVISEAELSYEYQKWKENPNKEGEVNAENPLL